VKRRISMGEHDSRPRDRTRKNRPEERL
jgi:hypothetical protein